MAQKKKSAKPGRKSASSGSRGGPSKRSQKEQSQGKDRPFGGARKAKSAHDKNNDKNSGRFGGARDKKNNSSAHSLKPTPKQQKVQVTAGTLVLGAVKRHPDGFGFLIPEQSGFPDVYIPRHEMHGVMSGDKIEVRLQRDFAQGPEERWRGTDLRIRDRAVKRIVGRYVASGASGMVMDESMAWGAHLQVAKEASGGAKNGDLVAAEIESYPSEDRPFSGRIISVIGDPGNPLSDIQRVVHLQNLPYEFSPETKIEAQSFPKEVQIEKELSKRKDLRNLHFVTIDGATAKDFDDAVYVEANNSGFRLWVAIADVSHYVKPGSAIDKDAYERGTSSYFPNFVIPMLPEILSEELCSLKPNVPRFTMVCEMQISHEGQILESHFYEGIIQSHARVTYGEAQEVIDGQTVERLSAVTADIRRAGDLAKILMSRRFSEGSLDLEMPETVLEVDAQGVPVEMVRAERLFSHRLIEELMLIANIATARLFAQRDVPAIYRIHEEPDPDSLENLERFLFNFGAQANFGTGMLQKKLTQALRSVKSADQGRILSTLTLRSMKQAKYSSKNVGHFGLAFSDYTHFTSPIRRYPDLIVHRLIKACLGLPGYRLMSEDDLATAGTVLSACEQRAVKAERLIVSIKKARFALRFVGQTMEGIISSVTKFGVFVVLREYDVDGLIRLEALGTERFEFDSENLVLRGQRSGKKYSIGDPMTIVVAASNPESGQIDFVVAKEPTKSAGVVAPGQTQFDKDTRESGEMRRGGFTPQKQANAPIRGKDLFTVSQRGLKSKEYGDSNQESDSADRSKRRSASNDRNRVRKARFSKHR